jgi:hypothetical protein
MNPQDRDIFNFDIKYRPTRLLGLNDTEAEIESLSVDNVYKTTLGRLSKKTAFWIANNAEVPGGELCSMIRDSFKLSLLVLHFSNYRDTSTTPTEFGRASRPPQPSRHFLGSRNQR